MKDLINKIWNGDEISIEEKRSFIKNRNEYMTFYNEDNWILKNTPYEKMYESGISTEILFNSMIQSEIDKEIKKGNISLQYK